jgi:hypothetical protein
LRVHAEELQLATGEKNNVTSEVNPGRQHKRILNDVAFALMLRASLVTCDADAFVAAVERPQWQGCTPQAALAAGTAQQTARAGTLSLSRTSKVPLLLLKANVC